MACSCRAAKRRRADGRALHPGGRAATIIGAWFGRHVVRFPRTIALIDALGLGAYAVFGTQKALLFGLAVPPHC
jgi:hypothetical protein